MSFQIYNGKHEIVDSGRDAIPKVAKSCEIMFSLSNREKFPLDAMVYWTVRNFGREAEEANDLGHGRSESMGNSVKEHTAYAGSQYMDCIVKRYGQIIGFRRVPVRISR